MTPDPFYFPFYFPGREGRERVRVLRRVVV